MLQQMLLSLRVSLWLVAVSRPVESHSRARGNILTGALRECSVSYTHLTLPTNREV